MTKLLLDTYALFELVEGTDKGRKVLARVKSASVVLVSALNLYELWYLTAEDHGEDAADVAVGSIKALAQVVPASEQVALVAARLKRAHSGKGIGAVDFVTAASAILSDAIVLSGDSHFREITESKVDFL